MTPRARYAAAALALALLAPGFAGAAEPDSAQDNQCAGPGGQGEPCLVAADCELNAYATLCVEHTAGDATSRRCEIPCEGEPGAASQGACALGETCVASAGDGALYCQASAFRVDLNLLDQCITSFIDGLVPSLGSANTCSLEANLARLLDQDGDFEFDIFDVDLCVLAFLRQPACDPLTRACPESDMVFCDPGDPGDPDNDSDADCGAGLYCDAERYTCARDCGYIASREPGLGVLDRQCTGHLKACDHARGRCEPAELEGATCQVDGDCPSGAYCFLGQCAPRCFRSVECPSGWQCTANNTCRTLPPIASDGAFVFDPLSYALRFARDGVVLDAIDFEQVAPLLVMDLVTRKQVVDNASVSFGFRLEITYDRKSDPKCLKPDSQLTDDDIEDCLIDDTEQWITPLAPFGTVVAVGTPAVRVRLAEVPAGRLTPGLYTASVRAIFDNGDEDSFKVSLRKTTPSGEYRGNLTVYLDSPDNALTGARPLPLSMRISVKEETRRWTDLLAEENLQAEQDIIDVTEGNLVHGRLHGRDLLHLTLPSALSTADDEIPVKGIYSPRLGRMRLLAVVDIPAGLCVGEDGECDYASDTELQARNHFGRDIRRVIDFVGPFDETKRVFHGIYRERISGLMALAGGDVTLDGGFIMNQTAPDDSALELDGPLLDAGAPAEVSFPALSAILADIAADEERWCGPYGPNDGTDAGSARHRFYAEDDYDVYLDTVEERGHVLEDMVQFNELIENALSSLGEDTGEALTLYDFLEGRILVCPEGGVDATPEPGTTAPPACIAEEDARCGLALYRKAALSGWVNLSNVGDAATGELELFCSKALPLPGCELPAAENPTLFTLQEHNRFHQELSQALRFQAGADMSDAFFAMYRHAVSPFGVGEAVSFREQKLRGAVARFDELLELIVGTESAAILAAWPMDQFKSRGDLWLPQMQSIVADRLDALAELVDLKRRVFGSSGGSDLVMAHHLMQQEYLAQVYLLALQRQWQGPSFSYTGNAAAVFDRGRSLLLQLDESKNPLGISPDRVFFENSDRTNMNWRNYRALLLGQGGEQGLIAKGHEEIELAVHNLKGSLSDIDSLEQKLFDGRAELLQQIDAMCGPSEPHTCNNLIERYKTPDEWIAMRDCKFNVNIYQESCDEARGDLCVLGVNLTPQYCEGEFRCERVWQDDRAEGRSGACKKVVEEFRDYTDALSPRCRAEDGVTIEVEGRQRACVGGRMGELLQEKLLLDIKREQVIGNVELLIRQLDVKERAIRKVAERKDADEVEAAAFFAVDLALQAARYATHEYGKYIGKAIEELNCLFVVGLAAGTDCGTKLPFAALAKEVKLLFFVIETSIEKTKEALSAIREVRKHQLERAMERDEQFFELEADALDLLNHFSEFETFTQEVFNVGTQIEDLKYQAQAAADRHAARVGFIADHLIGRETGSVLVGEQLVADSAKTFREILAVTYKMVVAFGHRYNLSAGETEALTSQVFASVTLSDVEGVIASLDAYERQYCGREGIDCDSYNNLDVLRLSLRDTLFPGLTDIVDANTGAVLTKGEQFHNIITSPPYLQRRIRATQAVDQIEIPFAIWLDVIQGADSSDAYWMVSPLDCNHVIDGDPTAYGTGYLGTVAVNVLGRNLEDPARGVEVELWRGAIDHLRSCYQTSTQTEIGTDPVLEYPIRRHVVGYPPENSNAQQASPPSFATRSSRLSACVNAAERAGSLDESPCWSFFARDRSLAAPDWKLVVPLRIGSASTRNTWLLGDGLPAEQLPVIEDIVVYVRHRTRPVQEF